MNDKYSRADDATLHQFARLSEWHPWPLIVQSVVGHLAWTPVRMTGISKAGMVADIVAKTLEAADYEAHPAELQRITNRVRRDYDASIQKSLPSSRYDRPNAKGPIHPTEALRRNKFFDEYILNAEFDLLISLLGGSEAVQLFRTWCPELQRADDWNYLGNTRDTIGVLNNLGIWEVQVDGLLYSEAVTQIVAPELKLSTGVGPFQLAKYASGLIAMEDLGLVAGNSSMHMVVIGEPNPGQVDNEAVKQSALDRYLKDADSGSPKAQGALPHRRTEILRGFDRLSIVHISWQQFADLLGSRYLEDKTSGTTTRNLVRGFLWSLEKKRDSRRPERPVLG